MSVQPCRKFDSDFKRNAVLLSQDPNRSSAEIAKTLEYQKSFFTGGVKSIAYGKNLPSLVMAVRL